MQRTICTESDEGLGVRGEAGEGRNCVGQVDPAEYRNLVPDLMEGFIYTTAEVAFHPLTHILSQISVVLLSDPCCLPRTVCVWCRGQGMPAVMRVSGSHWQVIMTSDSSSLSSGNQQFWGGFPLLCLPSWQASRRSNGVCGASSSCRGAVSSAVWLLLWLTRAWFSKLDGSCNFLSSTEGSAQTLPLIVVELFYVMTSHIHTSLYVSFTPIFLWLVSIL